MQRKEVAALVVSAFTKLGYMHKAGSLRLPNTFTPEDTNLFWHSYAEVTRLHNGGVIRKGDVVDAMTKHSLTSTDVDTAVAYMSLRCFAKPADLYRALRPYVTLDNIGPSSQATIAEPVIAHTPATIRAAVAHVPAAAAGAQTPAPYRGQTWEVAKQAGASWFAWQRQNDIPVASNKAQSQALFTKANANALLSQEPVLKDVVPVDSSAANLTSMTWKAAKAQGISYRDWYKAQGDSTDVVSQVAAAANVPVTQAQVAQTSVAVMPTSQAVVQGTSHNEALSSIAGMLAQAANALLALAQGSSSQAIVPAAPVSQPVLDASPVRPGKLSPEEARQHKAESQRKYAARRDAALVAQGVALAQTQTPALQTLSQRLQAQIAMPGADVAKVLRDFRAQGFTMAQLESAIS